MDARGGGGGEISVETFDGRQEKLHCLKTEKGATWTTGAHGDLGCGFRSSKTDLAISRQGPCSWTYSVYFEKTPVRDTYWYLHNVEPIDHAH